MESTRGTPVSGAVISVFGKGMGNGGFVTLTDSAGQFVLPRLPAGSYTLRALDSGHVPYPARRFTVLPDRDATFTLSLTPIGETASPAKAAPSAPGQTQAEDEDAAAIREWRWLLRHKRRSVLRIAPRTRCPWAPCGWRTRCPSTRGRRCSPSWGARWSW
ncbi:MAG TPA: carboxypeptidase-like regulatory domain-containing protein, partial [Candidatus Methylomirabilis sp.]|nr:carboxypeptidase-like regulatory domain-containing protein [Candidatus Methylomirabilis sp.]